MTLGDLVNDYRKGWEKHQSITRETNVAYAALHGIVERIQPEQYNEKIGTLFKDAKKEIFGRPIDPQPILFPVIQTAILYGLDFKAYNLGRTANCLEFSNLSDVRGWFGYVANTTEKGTRIILEDEEDTLITEDAVFPQTVLDGCAFPKEYRKEGSGVCWVEYVFWKHPSIGRLEPASTIDYKE